ncbi:hypothetical protein YN1_1420 [Nanoarchaeota archaeon]
MHNEDLEISIRNILQDSIKEYIGDSNILENTLIKYYINNEIKKLIDISEKYIDKNSNYLDMLMSFIIDRELRRLGFTKKEIPGDLSDKFILLLYKGFQKKDIQTQYIRDNKIEDIKKINGCEERIRKYIREIGFLVNNTNLSEIECSRFNTSKLYTFKGKYFPEINKLEDLLYIIPSMYGNIKDNIYKELTKNDHKIEWIKNEDVKKVFKEYCKNKCSILDYYNKIIDPNFSEYLKNFLEYKDIIKPGLNDRVRYEKNFRSRMRIELEYIYNKKVEELMKIERVLEVNSNIFGWLNIAITCLKIENGYTRLY